MKNTKLFLKSQISTLIYLFLVSIFGFNAVANTCDNLDLTEDVPQECLDSSKHVYLCYASFNNEKEYELLKNVMSNVEKSLGKTPQTRIHIIELMQGNRPDPKNVFSLAIESGIKCSGLVISGHHTSSFSGKRAGGYISIDEMESMACGDASKSAESKKFFESINSLWLQGCRTLGEDKTAQDQAALAGRSHVQFHATRVARVLEEDGLTHLNEYRLQQEFANIFDVDNPFSTRINRAFANALTFGWTMTSPGEVQKSENSILYHLNNLVLNLEKSRGQNYGMIGWPQKGSFSVKDANRLYDGLMSVLLNTHKCTSCITDGWIQHGNKMKHSDRMGFYNPALATLLPIKMSSDPRIVKAKEIDCKIRANQSLDELQEAMEQALSDPGLADYVFYSIRRLLNDNSGKFNIKQAAIVKKALRENKNFAYLLYRKLASPNLSLPRKIEFYAFYRDIKLQSYPEIESEIKKVALAFILAPGARTDNYAVTAKVDLIRQLLDTKIFSKGDIDQLAKSQIDPVTLIALVRADQSAKNPYIAAVGAQFLNPSTSLSARIKFSEMLTPKKRGDKEARYSEAGISTETYTSTILQLAKTFLSIPVKSTELRSIEEERGEINVLMDALMFLDLPDQDISSLFLGLFQRLKKQRIPEQIFDDTESIISSFEKDEQKNVLRPELFKAFVRLVLADSSTPPVVAHQLRIKIGESVQNDLLKQQILNSFLRAFSLPTEKSRKFSFDNVNRSIEHMTSEQLPNATLIDVSLTVLRAVQSLNVSSNEKSYLFQQALTPISRRASQIQNEGLDSEKLTEKQRSALSVANKQRESEFWEVTLRQFIKMRVQSFEEISFLVSRKIEIRNMDLLRQIDRLVIEKITTIKSEKYLSKDPSLINVIPESDYDAETKAKLFIQALDQETWSEKKLYELVGSLPIGDKKIEVQLEFQLKLAQKLIAESSIKYLPVFEWALIVRPNYSDRKKFYIQSESLLKDVLAKISSGVLKEFSLGRFLRLAADANLRNPNQFLKAILGVYAKKSFKFDESSEDAEALWNFANQQGFWKNYDKEILLDFFKVRPSIKLLLGLTGECERNFEEKLNLCGEIIRTLVPSSQFSKNESSETYIRWIVFLLKAGKAYGLSEVEINAEFSKYNQIDEVSKGLIAEAVILSQGAFPDIFRSEDRANEFNSCTFCNGFQVNAKKDSQRHSLNLLKRLRLQISVKQSNEELSLVDLLLVSDRPELLLPALQNHLRTFKGKDMISRTQRVLQQIAEPMAHDLVIRHNIKLWSDRLDRTEDEFDLNLFFVIEGILSSPLEKDSKVHYFKQIFERIKALRARFPGPEILPVIENALGSIHNALRKSAQKNFDFAPLFDHIFSSDLAVEVRNSQTCDLKSRREYESSVIVQEADNLLSFSDYFGPEMTNKRLLDLQSAAVRACWVKSFYTILNSNNKNRKKRYSFSKDFLEAAWNYDLRQLGSYISDSVFLLTIQSHDVSFAGRIIEQLKSMLKAGQYDMLFAAAKEMPNIVSRSILSQYLVAELSKFEKEPISKSISTALGGLEILGNESAEFNEIFEKIVQDDRLTLFDRTRLAGEIASRKNLNAQYIERWGRLVLAPVKNFSQETDRFTLPTQMLTEAEFSFKTHRILGWLLLSLERNPANSKVIKDEILILNLNNKALEKSLLDQFTWGHE